MLACYDGQVVWPQELVIVGSLSCCLPGQQLHLPQALSEALLQAGWSGLCLGSASCLSATSSHSAEEETEGQEGQVTSLRSHNPRDMKSGLSDIGSCPLPAMVTAVITLECQE
jgi:hypothetical protein